MLQILVSKSIQAVPCQIADKAKRIAGDKSKIKPHENLDMLYSISRVWYRSDISQKEEVHYIVLRNPYFFFMIIYPKPKLNQINISNIYHV